jgi:hypothetical protein
VGRAARHRDVIWDAPAGAGEGALP